MPLRYTHQSPEIWTAEYESVFIAVLLENATVELLDVMQKKEREMMSRQDGKFSVITIVPQIELKPVGDDVRKRSSEMMAEFGPNIVGTATIVGGSGFFPSLVRSILSGVALLSRVKIPQKSFGDAQAAATWLADLEGQSAVVRDNAMELGNVLLDVLHEAEVSLD